MNNALAWKNNGTVTVSAHIQDKARDYVEKSLAPATHKAHRIDWGQFEVWCAEHGLNSLPANPETVAYWLSDKAERYKPSTLSRKLASISKAHQVAEHDSPTRTTLVRSTLAGIKRSKREAGESIAPKKKDALLPKDLRRMVELMPDGLQGIRDRAILLLGFAGGFRRSELSALDVDDLKFMPEGVLVSLKSSKTNQDGSAMESKDIGMGAHVETCPVRALRTWLDRSGAEEGPVFRPLTRGHNPRPRRLSGHAIAMIVKKHAERVGFAPESIGAHSLRAGLVTALFNEGVPIPQVKALTGHRSDKVVGEYWRKAKQFSVNLSSKAGL